MKALDRKLLRDLSLMWSQALTIALVVASGVGGFIATLSAVDSLDAARERFYVQGRFANVFASMKRAPLTLLPVIRPSQAWRMRRPPSRYGCGCRFRACPTRSPASSSAWTGAGPTR